MNGSYMQGCLGGGLLNLLYLYRASGMQRPALLEFIDLHRPNKAHSPDLVQQEGA